MSDDSLVRPESLLGGLDGDRDDQVNPAVPENESTFSAKGGGEVRGPSTTIGGTGERDVGGRPFGADINVVPGKYRRLIPNENPHWESPRPVRKGGPGGKYVSSIVPPQEPQWDKDGQRSNSPSSTASSPRKQNQRLLEEHLQKELRVAQQLADSRLKDLQKQKMELVRVQTKNTNLNKETATLKTATKAHLKEATQSQQSFRDCQNNVRRLKNKLKTKKNELNKRTKALSKTQAQLASVTQQRDDLATRSKTNGENNAKLIQTLRDRVEAADRHCSEQLGYTKRELEDVRIQNKQLKQQLSKVDSELTVNQINLKRKTTELQQEQNTLQVSVAREKGERKQWKRLWSDTVEKLQQDNSNLWVQLQFMETALLEDELDRDPLDFINQSTSTKNKQMSTSLHRQPSPKESRRARRLLQKRVEIQEDASQQAIQIRHLEVKLVESRHEHAITAGRLDFAETKMRELLSELHVQDHANSLEGHEKGLMRSSSTSKRPQHNKKLSFSGSKPQSKRSASRPLQQQSKHQKRGQYQGGRRLKDTSKLEVNNNNAR